MSYSFYYHSKYHKPIPKQNLFKFYNQLVHAQRAYIELWMQAGSLESTREAQKFGTVPFHFELQKIYLKV